MNAWEILDAISERKRRGESYYEFFRDSSLSLGIYGLSAGENDPQQPHTEDEVYYIVRGSGRMRVGDQDRAVTPGSVVFVEAGAQHRFHSREEDLEVLGALERSAPFLHRELVKRIRIKRVPRLRFVLDESIAEADRKRPLHPGPPHDFAIALGRLKAGKRRR